ncbi:MAG: hypothetical protein ACI84C_000310 [Flavobacteriales bacterium]|jgi:hypothetical protein
MIRSLFLLLITSGVLSFSAQAQVAWPAAPSVDYPAQGSKSHSLDYVMVDVANWEEYIVGTKFQTNKEIPAQITYYTKDNEFIFSTTAGIRLSGIFIRKLPQKSIAVEFSTREFQSEKVFYNIFPTRDYDRIRGFVLRAHGNPMGLTFFKDAMMNESVDEHTDLEYSGYRPVIVYINGKYQGLHNLREKKDKDYLKSLHNLSGSDIVVFDVDGGVNAKPNVDWEEMMAYVSSNDLSKKEHYDWMSDRVEIDNFIEYHICHMFYSNTDWPKANVKVWRPKGGKWRWMFFDCDRGFMNVNFNMIEHNVGQDQWALRRQDEKVDARLNKSTILIRELMTNDEFALKFARRYQDLLNTAFTPERLNALVASCADRIRPEVSHHITYWKDIKNEFTYQYVKTLAEWNQNVSGMAGFIKQRPGHVRKHINDKFDLGGHAPATISIADPLGGYLQVNSMTIEDASFTGEYFKNLPIDITAYPKEGYAFDRWEGLSQKSATVTITRDQMASGVTAVFKAIEK